MEKRKVKMLVTCRAYLVNTLLDFEKGKEYDVNELLYKSFTESNRATDIENVSEIQLPDNAEEMNKEELKEHCKKSGLTFKGNPSIKTIINKIKEVCNGNS